MSDLNIRQMEIGPLDANAYLVWREGRQDALIVDPGDDLKTIETMLAASGKTLTDILLTHGHFDHILSAAPLAQKYGAHIHIHPKDAHMLTDKKAALYSFIVCEMRFTPIEADMPFPDEEQWEMDVCGIHFKGLRTPGHTKGSVCLLDEEHKVMFTGDTIFAYGCGRMDFPGGSEDEMAESITTLIHLDEKFIVYSGHGMADTMGNIAERWK